MKLDISTIPDLLTKHIFELTEEELRGLAFILTLDISEYEKSDHLVRFKMMNAGNKGYLECSRNSNISMGRSRGVRNGMSGLTSWGGQFSFTDAVFVFKTFIARGFEITMQSPEKLKVYSKDEWQGIFSMVSNAIFGQK